MGAEVPVTDPRGYSSGTRAALAHLSRGTCYNPDCTCSIIRFIDGEPYVDYQIAHIRDAKLGNRYDPDMTDDQRRAFANLILLCKPCHTRVDKTHLQDYNVERLEAWKRRREGSASEDLAALGPMDEDKLGELVTAAVRAALGNPTLAVSETGGFVRITGAGLPRLLPLEPAILRPRTRAAPSRLVRARSGIVPFVVHQDVRASLLDWCLDGRAFSARVVGGGAGVGKTRLGVELCEDLAPFGWVRGLLTPEFEQPEVEALLAAPTARLVVVDYAETRAAQLATLLPRLAACATAEEPVRALLLIRARRGEDWTAPLRNVSEALDVLVDDMGVDVLNRVPLDETSRLALFASAAAAFAEHASNARAVPAPPETLEGPVYATPLLVVIRAYLEVHGDTVGTLSRSDLLEELLAHEDRYWSATGPDAPSDPVLRRRVVAFATLAGASSEADAADRLRLVPDLVDADKGRRRALARWANALYQGRLSWWNPLEPDLVAEHLVSRTYHDQPEVLAGVLIGTADVVTRPIGLYARAAPDHPQLSTALLPVLNQQLLPLCQLAIDQAGRDTDRDAILGETTVAAALTRWARVTEADTDVLLDAVDRLPPRPDLVLSPLAVVLTAQEVHRLRALAAANPAAYEPDLARSLNNLSNRLGEVGRRDEGLAAITEAVAVYRRLAAANPAAYEPDLAGSLNNLSNRLGEVGRREEGLAAITEAVAVYRRLAAAIPAAYEPDLAGSLNNLSVRLGEAGRSDEGLAAVSEAVAMRRRLAAANPAAYEPDLAMSLNNLSNSLADVGQRDESLAAVEEAVVVYRRLAAANPAAYEPDLAMSLNNLSSSQGEVGRRHEGLAAITEAVVVYRRLAAANPAAYEPDLARSLNNLSSSQGEVGRRHEGLAAITEAVAMRRRLAAANPAAYEPALAMALNNLSIHLSGAGRRDEGLAAIEEAVAVYRRLAAANPAAYQPALATSLDNLSIALGEAGRREAAETTRSEAVEIQARVRRMLGGPPSAP